MVGEPVASDNARVVPMRWIGSSSSGITRYDLLVGTSPGMYQAKIEVPRKQAGLSGEGVYSYNLTLREDLDYYISMQAYDGRLLSAPSNEIILAATAPLDLGPSASSSAQAMPAPTPAQSSGTTALTRAQSSSGENVLAESSPLPPSSDSDQLAPASSSDSIRSIQVELASLELDGQQRYLGSDTPEELGATEALSLSLWMRPFLDASPRRLLFELSPSSFSQEGLGLSLSLLDGQSLECVISDANGQLQHRAIYALPLANDLWQHLGIVFDPSAQGAPQVLLDGFEADILLSEGPGQVIDLTDLTGFVRVGGSGLSGEMGFLGRLGHLGLWRDALSPAAFSEIQLRGHDVDLRDPVGAYVASESLIHYWRLGDASPELGYDLGFADRLLDLDDPAGGLTRADLVQDGPASLIAP
ncbi:MAG: hypothetical protein P8M78_15565 [Myxococcota bacterium]|nr:hypothetical protein [Myxococcota bacterium]